MMLSALAAATLGLALVAQDNTALRAAPSGSAQTQAQLAQGDLLEVRGERLDHLQVYDHQRERAGFVKTSQLRPLALTEAEAPQLLAVLRFLRDTPGAEALGIAYAAAYLKAAPAAAINAEPFDALGSIAERLARRASSKQPSSSLAAHLEVAGRYGVKFTSFERDGAMQLCYDGEAFQRVLALQPTPEQQARAVLALTRSDCIAPTLPLPQRQRLDRARAELLDQPSATQWAALSEPTRNRLRLRRAALWAALAHQRARAGQDAAAAEQRALDELAAVNKAELGDDEQAEHAEAALRVAVSRWAAVPLAAQPPRISLQPGEPGQTCVQLAVAPAPLRRCTYGQPWLASARWSPDGRALVLAVQTLEAWTELWVARATPSGWTLDVLPPAADPGLGYIEFAGWVGQGEKLLVARENRIEGRQRRSFEVLSTNTLATEKQAGSAQLLAAFNKWQDAGWKRLTLSLR
jgi:hypothetical protein